MSDIAIRVENLGKMYRIGAEEKRPDNLWQAARQLAASPFDYLRRITRPPTEEETLWALKDVSFEVQRGEVVGIIGRNGAGKSTLLKILSRITEPTHGRAQIYGRVGSLLEVGTGFHPELTGRENIYLNGAILGMRREEIDRKFDEIVDFSGVERFLDTPVKRYSSGMRVRLAFSVAAHLDPEILLVDEVLAVGDAAFQKKCLGKMGDVAKEGRTVVLVSHNMPSILGLCERSLLMSSGKLAQDGCASQVVEHYLSIMQGQVSIISLQDRADRSGDNRIKLTHVDFGTQSDPQSGFWVTGEEAIVQLRYECAEDRTYKNIELALGILNHDQTRLLYLGTKILQQDIEFVRESGTSECRIPRLPLEPGQYYLVAEVKQNGVIVDRVAPAAKVDVMEGDYYGTGVIWPYGGFLCDYSWSHNMRS